MNQTKSIFSLFATPIYLAQTELDNFDNELNYLKNVESDFNSKKHPAHNTTIVNEPELYRCKQIIEYHLNKYVEEVFSCEQEFYITNTWVSRKFFGEGHKSHMHPNSIISGVLYLQANENASDIKFYKKSALKETFSFDYHIRNHNFYNSDSWAFSVKTGDIIIFPSSLEHEVDSNLSNSERVILGFNTFVKGSFGKNNYCSDLIL